MCSGAYPEDSASTALSTRQLMQQHGLQITEATSGEDALALLKANVQSNGEPGFDMVFTDFFLAGQMTGGDLLYAIRAQLHYSLQELPVLVVTIPDNEDCQADIFHAGANDFITKPVVEEVLIARLKSLLMIRHQYNVLKRYSKDMYQLATTDALTGVRNKQFLLTEGPDFVKKHSLLCLLMMDIDNMEDINEEHGDIIGDHILHMVGQFLQTHFSSEEDNLIARFGGRRFCILLGEQDLQSGRAAAEGLRQNIAALKPENIAITTSIGLASSENMTETTLNALMSDADRDVLYGLREKGPDQVSVCTIENNFE
ncbi:MAG: diguanylate cyclase [Pseudomonadota bacterium]